MRVIRRQGRLDGLDHYLKADIERGFIEAYYKYVQGCRVILDGPSPSGKPFVATAARRMKEKVEELRHYTRLWAEHESKDGSFEFRYEVWCFIPPDKKVLYAFDQAVQEQLPVVLVSLDEVRARLRETVLALPAALKGKQGQTAFVESALFFRQAWAL